MGQLEEMGSEDKMSALYGLEPDESDEDAEELAAEASKKRGIMGASLCVMVTIFLMGGIYMAAQTDAEYTEVLPIEGDMHAARSAQHTLPSNAVGFEEGPAPAKGQEGGLLDWSPDAGKADYTPSPTPAPAKKVPPAHNNKPMPKPAPLMSREAWEHKLEKEKKEAKKKVEAHEKNEMILHMVQDGDWYWSGPRTGRRPKNQCFLNATERRQDYWLPVEGNWKRQKRPIPIYGIQHAHSLKSAQCFGHVRINYEKTKSNQIRKKKGKMVFETIHTNHCGEQGNLNARMMFTPTQCNIQRLWDANVLKLLQGHRVWFIGDYVMRQQYDHLRCLMSVFVGREGTHKAGTITGEQGPYAEMKGSRISYLYAGLTEDPNRVQTDTAAKYKVEGLGKELREQFGLDQVKGIDAKTKRETAQTYATIEIADVLTERMDEFLAGDVIIMGMGSDYDEPRAYQATLLKFLQLYEDQNDQLPVVIWRENPAQHHLGYESGDILVPLAARGHADMRRADQPAFVAAGKGYNNEEDAPNLEGKELIKWRQNNVQCGEITLAEFEEHNWRNKLANRLVEAAGIPILRIWKATTMQSDWYKKSCGGGLCDRWGPCMHFCSTSGALTYFNELTLTLLDSQPLQDTFKARENMTYVDETPPTRKLLRAGAGGRGGGAGRGFGEGLDHLYAQASVVEGRTPVHIQQCGA